MKVTINGKIEEIVETTLIGLLQSKNIEPQMVSIEINAVMLNRADYPSTTLNPEDNIEFLYFMGGGSSDPGRYSQPVGLPEGRGRCHSRGGVINSMCEYNICL